MSKNEFETTLKKNGWTWKQISELTNSLIADSRVRPFDYANYIDESEVESILRVRIVL
jgi:hypothetical protein